MSRLSRDAIKNFILVAGLYAATMQGATALEYGVVGSITASDNSQSTNSDDLLSEQLDFYSSGKIIGDLSFIWEYVIENSNDHFDAHTERFQLEYSFNDQFNLSAGRFHSLTGYWNRNFHHGKLLHDTVERPFFIDFRRNQDTSYIMPSHITGAQLNGNIETPDGTWVYEAMIGNAPGINTTQSLDGHTINRPEIEPGNFINPDNLSLSFRLNYAPGALPIQFGIFGMKNEIQEFGRQAEGSIARYKEKLLDQFIAGVEFSGRFGAFDAITEYFALNHRNEINQGGSFNANAYYVQLGYRINNPLKIIYRYSRLNFDDQDLYFQLLSSQEQYHHIATLRYDINEYNALKLEVDQQNNLDGTIKDSYTYRMQWAFLLDNPLDFLFK